MFSSNLLLRFAYCCLEITFSLTHFYVFIGYKNPSLSHIRKEKYYFLGDGLCHFINIIMYYQSKSYLLLGFWGFLFLVHMFYFMHLIKYDFPLAENNLFPIFKWSCIGYKKDRFSFKESGSEMIQTILDILGHIFGAIFIVQGPYFWMFPWASLLVLISSLIFFRFYKYFVTEESMMPKKLITITKRLKSY